MPQGKDNWRECPDKNAPKGPLIPSARRWDHLKFPDEGRPQPATPGESLQSPVEIDVLTHVPCLIITAQFLEDVPPAELTTSLGHAANEPDDPPDKPLTISSQLSWVMSQAVSGQPARFKACHQSRFCQRDTSISNASRRPPWASITRISSAIRSIEFCICSYMSVLRGIRFKADFRGKSFPAILRPEAGTKFLPWPNTATPLGRPGPDHSIILWFCVVPRKCSHAIDKPLRCLHNINRKSVKADPSSSAVLSPLVPGRHSRRKLVGSLTPTAARVRPCGI